MKPAKNCYACGGPITPENVDGGEHGNPCFHKVCMNEGIRVPLQEGKYTDAELKGTWAEVKRA